MRIIVHASDVLLAIRPLSDVSVRNVLAGTIQSIQTNGPFAMAEIALEGGGRLAAVATRQAIDDLHLASGSRVLALVKTTAIDERDLAGTPVS